MFGRRHKAPLSLSVEARQADLARVRSFVEDAVARTRLGEKAGRELRLAVDEACANIIEHAYGGRSGPLLVEIDHTPDRLTITLKDRGQPIADPTKIRKAGSGPDLSRYVQTGKKGGLGLFLIHKLTDEVDYRREDDTNVLTLMRLKGDSGPLAWMRRARLASLRLRFIAQASCVLMVLLIAAYLFMRERQHVMVKRQTLEGAVTLAAELGAQAADLLLKPAHFGPKQTRLIAAARRSIDRQGVETVIVTDSENTVWAASDEDMIFKKFTAAPECLFLPPGVDELPRELADGAQIVDGNYWLAIPAALPAAAGGQQGDAGHHRLGTTYITVSASHVERVIASEQRTLFLGFCAVLAVGLGAITLLVSVVTKPIQRLTDGVRAIGTGKQQRLEENGLAEIDGIARAFNEVTDRFHDARRSLIEKERLEQEMEVAQSIQHSLLPQALPEMIGYEVGTFYRAAKEVGGDYYDIVKVGENAWGLAVADVSGKGVPGSLVMMMIRTALRLEARGQASASKVLNRVNEFMAGDMKRGMFVTMFYVLLDSAEREISYASAGHNPMVLYRAETDKTYFLNPGGFPVGIDLPDPKLFGDRIESERVSLNKDDLLVIYTDGITEAMNSQMEQYGMDRFLDAIKRYSAMQPAEFCTRLEQELAEWTGDAPQSDDMTLVAIKERLASDDLKIEARQRLLDLVEQGGVSVAEACRQAGVSTSTFYRLRRRREEEGAQGLKDRRRRAVLGRLAHEEEMILVDLVREHPEWGARRLTAPFSEQLGREIKEHRVADALKRLGLGKKRARQALADAVDEMGLESGSYAPSKYVGSRLKPELEKRDVGPPESSPPVDGDAESVTELELIELAEKSDTTPVAGADREEITAELDTTEPACDVPETIVTAVDRDVDVEGAPAVGAPIVYRLELPPGPPVDAELEEDEGDALRPTGTDG